MKKHLFLLLFAIVASISTTSAAITVRLDPQSCSSWSHVYLWAWTSAGNVFDAWPGEIVSKDADADGWYYYTFAESVTEVNIIWTNGTAQTVDITGITSSTCYALNSTSGTQIRVHEVDCPVGVLEHVKIGDLYYNLDVINRTAEVTYQEVHANNYSGLISANIPSSVAHNNISYSVTSIGESAFVWCSSLTSITIPNSVTSIGTYAFAFCNNLTSVTIGNSVTSIGYYAFQGCSSLTSVTIPNSVTSIRSQAFSNCSSLTSVTIGNSVTSIGTRVFEVCRSLTNVIWNAKKYESPSSSSYAPFYDIRSQITSFAFGNEVESIPSYLCYGMENLTSITIPNSVTNIGGYAFQGCSSLTFVTIPNSVKGISRCAFKECSKITNVVWNAKNCGAPIGGSEWAPFYDIRSQITSFVFGNEVESIPSYLCYGMENLTSITIPNSVTGIGEYAFHGCSSLTSVTCMATAPPQMGNLVFRNIDCSLIPLYVPAESVGLYKEANQWKEFKVLPIDFSGHIITFANWDGSVLQVLGVEEGNIPEYTGSTPTRPDDDEYHYTFSGWSPAIVAATEDATYTATYEASPLQHYTIRFENWDNSELQSIQVAENKLPVYTGSTPTRPDDEDYTYTFSGWSPTIVPAIQDATYTAKYEAKERAITVRLNPQSCTSWSVVRLWAWTANGNVFNAWPGVEVGKDENGWYSYTFDKSITSVSIIWNNETDQTVDINNVSASTCYSLNRTTGKDISASVVDCPSDVVTPIIGLYEDQNSMKAPHKFIRDGQLLILREGKVYNVQGQEVK